MSLPDSQQKAYAFLADTHNHENCGRVEYNQTNQSIVFAAGAYAYKLFKAIDRHRDNTTLEARLENAQLEMAANQALAADLYIGILAIVEDDKGRKSFANLDDIGERTVIDYVVKMHRFDEADLMYCRFFEERLTEQDMFQLGRKVALFHQNQPPLTDTQPEPYGAFYRDFSRTVTYFMEKVPHEGGKNYVKGLLLPGQDLIRKSEHHLKARVGKRCIIHGDLDFGNITTFNGELTPFDAQVLRGSRAEDPAKDLAFMLAPLLMKGEQTLAMALINGYQEVARDAELMHVLDLWVAYAALVRGGSWFCKAEIAETRDEHNLLLGYGNMFLTLAKALITGKMTVYP